MAEISMGSFFHFWMKLDLVLKTWFVLHYVLHTIPNDLPVHKPKSFTAEFFVSSFVKTGM